jgi:hypothetical protein
LRWMPDHLKKPSAPPAKKKHKVGRRSSIYSA